MNSVDHRRAAEHLLSEASFYNSQDGITPVSSSGDPFEPHAHAALISRAHVHAILAKQVDRPPDVELAGAELQSRYDDPRRIKITPSINHEVLVHFGDEEPIVLDALDLLRAVSRVVLGHVHGPVPVGGNVFDGN